MTRAAFLLLAAGCASGPVGEAVLAKRPALAALEPFAAPVPKLHTLANGLKLYVIEKPGDGIEALQLVVKQGSAQDPDALPGLASLALEMLEAGSAGRSQTEMAQAADSIGATVHASAGADASVVSASAMATQLEKLVQLLADVALRPNFAEAEWARLLKQRAAELLAAQAEPGVGAARAFGKAVYDRHPYGRPTEGTLASVKEMKLDDAKAFVAGFRPARAALVAVGGAPEAKVVELLRAAFEGWKGPEGEGAEAAPPQAAAPPTERPRLVIVDYPGKPQTVVRIGQPAVPRSSPEVLPLRLLNNILGGSFTSRLNQNLREKNGYAYGAGSGFAFGVGPGPFIARANVKTQVTAEALREALIELRRAVDEPISQAELEKGKALLAYDLVEALQSAAASAAAFGNLFLYDLPLDEFRTFVPRLGRLTAADVQAAARRVLDPAKMTIVLSGDAKVVEEQLGKSQLGLPAPQRRDAQGEVASR